jgi:hypothetical protein
LLEPLEAAFDDVAAPVVDAVEGWWSAAGGSSTGAVGSLVAAFGDGGGDATPP